MFSDKKRKTLFFEILQCNRDAITNYVWALSCTHAVQPLDRLLSFRTDHENHLRELLAVLEAETSTPAAVDPWALAYAAKQHDLTEEARRIGIRPPEHRALEVLFHEERLRLALYAKAAELDYSQDVRGLLARHLEDERRHLCYIERVLKESKLEPAA